MQGPGLLQEVVPGQQQGRPGALSKVQQTHLQGQHRNICLKTFDVGMVEQVMEDNTSIWKEMQTT